MLAGSVGLPRDPAKWAFEAKWDGVRGIVALDDSDVSVWARSGNEVTASYPELASPPTALSGRRVVLDGEIVAFDAQGRPSFERLQRRMHVRRPAPALVAEVPVLFVAFDLLWADGNELAGLPFAQRRHQLDRLGLDSGAWAVSPLLTGDPQQLLEACRANGLEGLMAKRLDSPYLPGQRSPAWSKVKCVRRREFVVGGWKPGRGSRSGTVGALALGCYENEGGGQLRYVGKVGSGLTEKLIGELRRLFAETATADCPFEVPPPDEDVRYVLPVLVVQVAFQDVSSSGVLRHPRLLGVRPDLQPAEVVVDAELEPAVE